VDEATRWITLRGLCAGNASLTLVRGCCTHPSRFGMSELFCHLLDTPTSVSWKGAGIVSKAGWLQLAGRAAGVIYRLFVWALRRKNIAHLFLRAAATFFGRGCEQSTRAGPCNCASYDKRAAQRPIFLLQMTVSRLCVMSAVHGPKSALCKAATLSVVSVGVGWSWSCIQKARLGLVLAGSMHMIAFDLPACVCVLCDCTCGGMCVYVALAVQPCLLVVCPSMLCVVSRQDGHDGP
jgi:hypothetical protein